MGEYLWEQGGDQEQQRLQALESLYDPNTLRLLDTVGVAEGWTCAEIGAGAGSVTDWLCQRVGSSGHVVAVDLTTRFLSGLQHDNLELRGIDINEKPLEEGVYDLIHARALLEHLSNREDVLAMFVAALRPGGVLVAEDVVLTGATAVHPPSELIDRINDAFAKGFGMAGADLNFGLKLPGALTAAGLEDVQADGHVPIVSTGTSSGAFHAYGLLHMGAWFVEAGLLTDDDVTQGLEVARAPGHTLFAPVMVAAWGYRPLANGPR